MTSYNDFDDHPVRDIPTKRPEETVKKMGVKLAMVSKLERSELEDKYVRLYEQYLLIKMHAQKQEDKIRRLGIVQQKLISDKRKILDDGGKTVSKTAGQADDRVEDLHEKLREMERQNGNLKEKLLIMKRQVSLSQGVKTMQVEPKVNSGTARQPAYDQRTQKNLRFAGSSSQRMGVETGISSSMLEEAQIEVQKRDQVIRELQDLVTNYEVEIGRFKEKLRSKDAEFEEERMQLKLKLNQDQKSNIHENIELIKMQRELREKSASLTQLHAKYTDLDEKMRLLKASHDQLLHELELANNGLQTEQTRSVTLLNQLKQGTSSNSVLAEHEEKIGSLERECQILKEANEQLLSNAFNLEKEKEWRSKEKALKLQIAQLEATLKADVAEKGGILDKLCEKADSHDQLEEEHRELRQKFYELKIQHDDLREKMKYFTQDTAVNMEELEEALVIIKHRKESDNLELDFLHKVDDDHNKDHEKFVKQLQSEHADTINELEKTRNMLIVQHKINKDYQAEVVLVTKKMDELKRESDLRLNEYAHLLDIRAARIKKLEAQLRDVAYGTRQYRIKPEDVDEELDASNSDEPVQLELGQNLFEIHITRVSLSGDGLKQMHDAEPSIFCTWEFYEFEMQSTPVQRGPRADFEFTSQYVVSVDDFFLHYLQKDSCVLELHQSFGTDYQTVAACHLRLQDILEKSQGRLHGTVVLTGVGDCDSGVNFGSVDYWVRLRVPMEQSLRLFKERSKALGYIESNVSKLAESKLTPSDDLAAKRAPENVNQLQITVVQCLNVKSRRKDVQPSPFCVYKFFDFSDHDTAIVTSSNCPHFDDRRKYPVPMTADLDKYLKTQGLKVYVLDDADPDEASYIGVATIPLITLAKDKEIQGTFELITKDGYANGTVDVILKWQYPYLPPTATSRTLKQSGDMSQQEPLPLLPGEEEALREGVVAGGPGVKKSTNVVKSPPQPSSPAATTKKSMSNTNKTVKFPQPVEATNMSQTSVGSGLPQAAVRSFSPLAAAMSTTSVPSVAQTFDSEITTFSEDLTVSGDSEPVSDVSTPRASVSIKSSVTDKRLMSMPASNGSETETSLSHSRNGARSQEVESQSREIGVTDEDIVENVEDIDVDDDDVSVTDPSESGDSDVIQSSRHGSNIGTGQVTSDEVRVTVSHATIDDVDILNNESIKMLYIEYSFLGVPLEETETPFTLPKMAGKPMNYNFTKVFLVDAATHLNRRQLLATMIIPNPNMPGHDKLKFTLVSDPPEEDDDCIDVGVAFVSILKILQDGRNVVNEEIPVYDVTDETKVIGSLEVSVECLLALKAIHRELFPS